MPSLSASPGYALDASWLPLLKDLGIRPADVLRRACLPDDLFSRPRSPLSTSEFFALWRAIETCVGDPLMPLKVIEALQSESFSPPVFAALCSPNLQMALQRIQKYKPLVAPMTLTLQEEAPGDPGSHALVLSLVWDDASQTPPTTLVAAELLFFVNIARVGTRERICPLRIVTPAPPQPVSAYESYFGARVVRGEQHQIRFAMRDALRPFLTANDSMWTVFEPDLRRRLDQLAASATMAERVRAVLIEGLPSGEVTMASVARKLAVSKRTLQRRLSEEGTAYQSVLQRTRRALAEHYLRKTALPVQEIAFLLGFEEPNSFYRAFGNWTGSTPETVRRGTPNLSAATN